MLGVRPVHEGVPAVRDEFGMKDFSERMYRDSFRAPDLSFFRVMVEQTDLYVGVGNHALSGGKGMEHVRNVRVRNGRLTARALREAEETVRSSVMACRTRLETQIRLQPEFLTSLIPLDLPDACPSLVSEIFEAARLSVVCPPLIAEMLQAAKQAGVGPMAAVAGALAEQVGRVLAERFSEVIVENGGDIWMTGTRDRVAGLFCGTSPLNGKLRLRLPAGGFPIGLCTSSGTIGHSLSFGKADAATVKAKNASLADAVATGFGNRVKTSDDIPDALEWASSIPGVLGLLVVIGDKMGAWGDMELSIL